MGLRVKLEYKNGVLVATPDLHVGENLIENHIPGLTLKTPAGKVLLTMDKEEEYNLTIEQYSYLIYDCNNGIGKIKVRLEPATLDYISVISTKNISAMSGIPGADGLCIACMDGTVYRYLPAITADPAAGALVDNNNSVVSTKATFEPIYDMSTYIYLSNKCGLFDLVVAPDGRWFILVSMPLKMAVNAPKPDASYSHVNQVYELTADGNFIAITELLYTSECPGGKLLLHLPYLYVATSDDPKNPSAQRLDTLYGKILRFDVSLPGQSKAQSSNPFVAIYLNKDGRPSTNNEVTEVTGAPEIYAYGLHCPTGLSLDEATNKIFCTDMGEHNRESVKIIGKGGNYGWDDYEGSMAKSGNNLPFVAPIFEYAHEQAKNPLMCKIIGGYPIKIGTHNCYLFGDISGRIHCIFDSKPDVYQQLWFSNISAYIHVFGRDSRGKIYVVLSDSPNRGQDYVYCITEY